jgi:UV DNA damage endonuclease
MRVGYPVHNLHIEGDEGTFRMIAYDRGRILEVVGENLDRLEQVLRFNLEHGLLFYRLPPDLVPYATRPRCRVDWLGAHGERLRRIGAFLVEHGMRVTVHPDLATVPNAPEGRVLREAVADLEHQCALLDALGLDDTHRIQVHVGVPGADHDEGIARFVDNHRALDPRVRARLAVENDNVFCTLEDSLRIHAATGVPVVFDVLHHEIEHREECARAALGRVHATWTDASGLPMVDYSSQRPRSMPGRHDLSIDLDHFGRFVEATRDLDFDLMCELKDRERSALRALERLAGDPRLRR